MYLATLCELANKLMWWFIFSQKVRKVSESQELCTAYFFLLGIIFALTNTVSIFTLPVSEWKYWAQCMTQDKKRKRGFDDKLKP